jgi:hypothetical protein
MDWLPGKAENFVSEQGRSALKRRRGIQMRTSTWYGAIFSGAFLLLTCPQVLLAQSELNQPAAPAVGPSMRIACPGVRSVPMTADPEQTLPLQIVANLKCGEEVTLLSDPGGYTVNVRTADAATGYVAGMYLKKSPRARVAGNAAILKNGVARWSDGAAGCDHFMAMDNSLVESVTLDGVTVQASLRDTGWKFRANVAIVNQGSAPIDVDPSKFILDSLGPHGKPLFYQDPAELAKNMTHQSLWTEADAAPVGVQSRVERKEHAETLTLDYRSPTPLGLPAPNYLVQHENAESTAIRDQGEHTLVNTSRQIKSLALKPGTIAPNDKASGAVWFDRDKNAEQLILRIPVGDIVFEFPLSFKQK